MSVFALVATGARPLNGANILKTETGATAHWDVGEILVRVDPLAKSQFLSDEDVLAALTAAAAAWNGVSEMRSRFVVSTVATAEPSHVSIRFCKGTWPNPAGLLAHTASVADTATGIMRSATVDVNECDFRFLGPDEVHNERFDLQSALTHELGHVLGLAHSADPRAVMFTSTGNARQRRPGADDRAGLLALAGYSRAPHAPVAQPIAAPQAAAPTVTTRNAPPVRVAPAPPQVQAQAPPAHTAPPQEVVAAVPLETARIAGTNVILYSCEPTLLPAMDLEISRPTPKRRRVPAGPLPTKPQRRRH